MSTPTQLVFAKRLHRWQDAPMSLLTAHRFTVDEFVRMAETGVLSPEARMELIEGRIIDMFPAME